MTFEKVGMDDVSLKGIQTKIGVGKDKLLIFVLKELVDNALDFMDRTGKPNPELKVSVKIDGRENKVRVTVTNSDFDLKGFTETSVKNIFNLSGYWSTKRNQYRITRGALGDALKTVLRVPFALADGNGIKGWDEPLIIKSGAKIFEVRLIVDKINQNVSSMVAVKERPLDDADIGLTVVEIILPVVKGLDTSAVTSYLYKYLLLNTHVTFHIDSIDRKGTFPACQDINLPLPYNPNFTSTWYYSLADFIKFIFGLSNNETPAFLLLLFV